MSVENIKSGREKERDETKARYHRQAGKQASERARLNTQSIIATTRPLYALWLLHHCVQLEPPDLQVVYPGVHFAESADIHCLKRMRVCFSRAKLGQPMRRWRVSRAVLSYRQRARSLSVDCFHQQARHRKRGTHTMLQSKGVSCK